MADNQNMSVEEILAACRADDGDGGGGSPAPAAESAAPAAEAAPASEAPATPASPAGPMDKSKMSVADMLAAARGEKSAAQEAAKPAAKAASPKKAPAKKEAAAPVASGPKDTSSILAAARAAGKPGPVSASEARAKGEQKPAKPKVELPPMPEKPAYAVRPAPAAAPADASDRRGFFSRMCNVFLGSSMAVGFTSLAITHLLWLLGLARFMFPNILTEPPTRFKVGFPDDFAPGQVETKFKAQFGIWLVRYEYQGQQQIYALKSVCTHLGCTPNWLEGEQKFKCPCHGSGFYKDGINFEGPAPRPLERYAIRLSDDGQLEVDKSRKFNEELGQWQDAASFVTV